MRRDDEQVRSAIAHFCNAVPLWGLVFNAFIWFDSRDKNPGLQRQAREAMLFHAIMLAALVVWMIVKAFTLLVGALFEPLAWILNVFNQFIIVALLAGHVGVCAWAGVRALLGEDFRYPLIDRFES